MVPKTSHEIRGEVTRGIFCLFRLFLCVDLTFRPNKKPPKFGERAQAIFARDFADATENTTFT